MGMTVGRIFEMTAAKFPNKEAYYDSRKDKHLTYRGWHQEVHALANAFLAAGVKKGDRISTCLYNTEEMGTSYFACAMIGGVFNPINFRLTAEETAFILEDAEPKIVLFEEATRQVIEAVRMRFPHISFWFIDQDTPSFAKSYQAEMKGAVIKEITVDVDENDLYAIMYTSGTTGRPKGVMHSHRDAAEQSLLCIAATGITSKDCGLAAAPMFHCAELHCAFLPRVHAGASHVFLHQFDPGRLLRLIESEKVSMLFAAPAMWNMILQEDLEIHSVRSLRLGLYGAAPMAPALVRACRDRLGIKLVQAYGMTEMGPAISFLSDEDQIEKSGSAGQAALNHEIRIVKPAEDGPSNPEQTLPPYETGEIIVRGPCMMSGYYNREEASREAVYKGWYHSGDLGYLDEDGFLYIKDRLNDMIISGGENIYPREVEDLLYEHPDVLEAAVIGEPHDLWGESVTAIIVKKDQNLTAETLEDFCKNSTRLANYKRPRSYIFLNSLPRNASGKILKYQIRQEIKR
ncbi:fatty acid--CoA ligase [Peribacillus sp. SCS-26]|uniref:fatty acid--CoA ligase n=1 Tax=Paraperibacillus marinus TaxID=3115295 RepID=UPI00390635C5